MKYAFDGLNNRLDIAEERITEFEEMSIKISKVEKVSQKKGGNNGTDHPRIV
jgi:hypothetical protein